MESINPSLTLSVFALISDPAYRPLKRHEIARTLQLSTRERQDLRHVLRDLEAEGRIICLRKNRWALPDSSRQATGLLRVTVHGFGFVTPEEADAPDIFIPPGAMSTALHGDRVLVSVVKVPPKRRRGSHEQPEDRYEGAVERVVELNTRTLVGLLRRTSGYTYVIPDSTNILSEVQIEEGPGGKERVADKHKVVVELLPREDALKPLRGKVVEDLGPADAPGVDMISLLREHKLDPSFDKDCMEQARAAQGQDREVPEGSGRRDLRSWLTFTIDPEDAKDYDDAVSLTRGKDGLLELGVHIADVSHYVQPDSAVDREAMLRGTSVYLVDRVISMLPGELTTDVCSLVPHQDRFAHSVIMKLTEKGELVSVETFPSLIHSKARLKYDQVQAFFDNEPDHEIPQEVLGTLTEVRGLSARIRKARMRNGAININLPEVHCQLGEDGRVQRLALRGSKEAYHVIEECMLLANRAVAKKILDHDVAGIYRIHLDPDNDQWGEMQSNLLALGIDRPVRDRATINKTLKSVLNTPIEYAVSLMILKTFKRAEYSTQTKGHFGLAFDHYTHFTSPIRRYPDLVTHRVLKAIERGAPPPYPAPRLAELAAHCSVMERNAAEAEMESLDIKRIDYFQELLFKGRRGPYAGLIVSIVPKGLIVELADSLQKGLVPFSSMTGDHFRVSADRTRATGKRSRKTWKLGMEVEVELTQVDTVRRLVDFRLVVEDKKPRKKKKKEKKPHKHEKVERGKKPKKNKKRKR